MCKNTTAINGSNANAALTWKFSGIMYAIKDIARTIRTGNINIKHARLNLMSLENTIYG